MAYDDAKAHPPRPFLFNDDFPAPTPPGEVEAELKKQWKEEAAEAHANIQFEEARREREELARRGMSGPGGQGHSVYPRTPDGPLSPREQERCLKYEEGVRMVRGGLPDSGGEPMATEGGGLPFKLD